MTYLKELRERWMKNSKFRAEYEALGPEFDLIRALISARIQSGLTQTQIAERMGTTQSAVARLEGGRSNPSMKTLAKYAKATGTRLRISFEPVPDDQSAADEGETRVNGAASTDAVDVEVDEPSAVSA